MAARVSARFTNSTTANFEVRSHHRGDNQPGGRYTCGTDGRPSAGIHSGTRCPRTLPMSGVSISIFLLALGISNILPTVEGYGVKYDAVYTPFVH